MAHYTKDDIIKAFLALVMEHNSTDITTTEISKLSGVTRAAINSNFGTKAVNGITKYIISKIAMDIEHDLSIIPLTEQTPEIFISILSKNLYPFRDTLHVFFKTKTHFEYLGYIMEKFNQLSLNFYAAVLEQNTSSPITNVQDLYEYHVSWIIAVLAIWFKKDHPETPEEFMEKFLYLYKNSVAEITTLKKD